MTNLDAGFLVCPIFANITLHSGTKDCGVATQVIYAFLSLNVEKFCTEDKVLGAT